MPEAKPWARAVRLDAVNGAATRFQDVAYASTVYNPVNEIFHPGNVYTNTFSIAQNGERTNFLTTVSHQKQDGVLRDHGAYDRTDLRIRSGCSFERRYRSLHVCGGNVVHMSERRRCAA